VTATRLHPALAAPRQPVASRSVLTLTAAAVTGLTLLIRVALHGRAFDIFGDEVIYADIGHSVASGGFPRFGGTLFFLHGPGYFYLEAGWARLWGSPSGLVAGIYQMRMLNALLAGITGGALVLLGTRAGSVWTGLVAGLLFAVDPFCIRQNDRVLLETALMMWVLLGYLLYTSMIGRRSDRDWLRAVGAGLLFGCAVLTKDEGALITILPVAAAALLRWGPSRRLALITVGTTVSVYALYLIVVIANGDFGPLWQAKTSGMQRMLGLVQTSGFHSSAGGSLVSRLVAEGPSFVTTYILLGLAVLTVFTLRRGGELPRMFGLLYCAAAIALGYALTIGTLEEQELYLLLVPSILIISVAASTWCTAARAGRLPLPADQVSRAAMAGAGLVLIVAFNLITVMDWAAHPDDGIARLLSYMAGHVPGGAKVSGAAGTDDIATYALSGQYQAGAWLTPASLAANGVHYVVVEWADIDEGYSTLTPAEVRALVQPGRVVFSFPGRTYGDLQLYQLPAR
jgi:hypothetical protein